MNYKQIGAVALTILALLFGSLWISCAVTTVIVGEGRLDYNYMKDRTVIIFGESEDNSSLNSSLYARNTMKKTTSWLGTGVIVKIDKEYTYILTNAHVAGKKRNGVQLGVKDKNRSKSARIIKYHNNLDLALIRITGILEEKKAINKINTTKISEKVYVVGHPLGNMYTYGEGVVAGWKGLYQYIQMPCMPGNSGSGVFNARGDLVAMLFAIDGTLMGPFPLMDVGHGIAVDGVEIRDF